ncbi:hypothetical protein Goari_004624 [Gossypium aridum]|uniref:DUF4283 domain-containing protein n=1 Tax=Gossypium aridum TaxID=34290 RepID=A0A7J8Y405_GOSAI|nr:hypothetical protein [Gossypium aridum]
MLGGKIGFNVLVNKITSLWSPKCPIQLMDLENDFFLVRFQDENDYNKALVGGPWVIFGRYLTVRPWSPDFSIAQSGIESQIGQTVGLVVKLDVHMDCAHRGRFAQLAVYVYLRKPLRGHGRFAALGVVEEESSAVVNDKYNGEKKETNMKQTNNVGENVLALQMIRSKAVENRAKQRAKGKKVMVGTGPNSVLTALRPISGRFGMKPNNGQDKENEVFKFGQKSVVPEEQLLRTQTVLSRQRGKPPDEEMGNQLQDSVELKSTMEGLVCDIERDPERDYMANDSQTIKEVMVVEDACSDEISLLICFVCLKLGVSGARADGIIAKIGYPNSFRVEANGFAGGIWLCWNDA